MGTILVVDDSVVGRHVVAGLLRKTAGCTTDLAADGQEALARIDNARPDLIVTDVHMPVLDALGLVDEVRRRDLRVPVILLTIGGNEESALHALQQGAAGYVHRAKLADSLPRTVDEVLAMTRMVEGGQLWTGHLKQIEANFLLDNDPTRIDLLIQFVQKALAGASLCDFVGRLQIGLALQEGLRNALFHGSLELSADPLAGPLRHLPMERLLSWAQERGRELPYRDRRIGVDLRIDEEQAKFVIRDQGPGFDVPAGPPEGDWKEMMPQRGHGLVLMRAFMDQLCFNSLGNEATMLKRRRTDVDVTDPALPWHHSGEPDPR